MPLVQSVPMLQARQRRAAASFQRGLTRFFFCGAVTLGLIAAMHDAGRDPGTLPAVARLSLQMPSWANLFRPETVFVTPDNSVFEAEQAMPRSALMARWEPAIQAASRKFNVPAQWIRAVMRQESGGRTVNPDNSPIVSTAGAMGVMQLMPGTYKEMAMQYGLGADPFDPHDNIYAGAAYLNWLHRKYGYPAMFAAYNDGPGNIDNHLHHGRPLPAETRSYIASIARTLKTRAAGLAKVALTQPDGLKVAIDPRQVTDVRPALPGIYAPEVHAVISMGRIHRGVREDVAEATSLLRAHGAAI